MQITGRFYWLTVTSHVGMILGLIPIILCGGWLVNSLAAVLVGLGVASFFLNLGATTSLVALREWSLSLLSRYWYILDSDGAQKHIRAKRTRRRRLHVSNSSVLSGQKSDWRVPQSSFTRRFGARYGKIWPVKCLI